MSATRDEAAVERAYLRRIKGYKVTEKKVEYKFNELGEPEATKMTKTTKHVPGDARAAEFWLINRRSEEWKPARLAGAGEDGGERGGVVELPEVGEEPEEDGEEDE